MLVDTHSHIYSEEYNGDTDEVLARALQNDVKKILLPNVDSSTVRRMLELSERFPDICYPMIGIHPTSVKEDFEDELQVFEYWLNRRNFCGIGEIGIDLYWDKKFLEEQIHVFRVQLQAAKRFRLPVSIHFRDSFQEVIAIVEEEKTDDLTGVFHAFSGNAEQAAQVIELGFKIGVGGVVTFKNSGLDKIIAQLKPENLVLETDAPWLTPAPYRGNRNESAYLILVRNKIAEIFNCSEKEINDITTQNAFEIFSIK